MADTSLIFNVLLKDQASDEMPDVASGLATAAAGAGVAAGAIIGASLVGAMDASAGADKLQAQLGITADRAAELGQVAGDVYSAAWGESMEEVRGAVGAVVSSIDGMREASTADIQDVTQTAMAFASTFDTDVNYAVQTAGQVMRTGLAGSAEEAFDLLFAASQKVPANVREDLIASVDEYGQFFAQLGYSGEEAFGALVNASDKGIFGVDKMGDAVKEFTLLATDGSTATADAMKSIGLDATEMSNAILQGGDGARAATQRIVDGLLGISDPSAQAAAAISLFGTPLEDLGKEGIPDFLRQLSTASGALGDVSGTADTATAALGDNAMSNIEGFKRQITTTFVEVLGGQILPYVDRFTSALNAGFGPALQKAGVFIKENEAWLKPLGAAVAGVAAAIGLLAIGIGIWNAVQAINNALMLANPIVLVVLAVAALIGVIVYLATQTQFFQTVWAGMTKYLIDPVKEAVDWMVAAWPGVWDSITGFFSGIGSWFADRWGEVTAGFDATVTWFRGAGTWLWNAITAPFIAIGSWFQARWDQLTGGVGWVIGFVRANWPQILMLITGPIGMAVGFVMGHWDQIKSGAASVISWFQGMPGRITSALSGLGAAISAPFRWGFNQIASLWNRSVANIGFSVPSWVPGVGGKRFDIPSIPMLADGGIVRATPGGTLALIGEGGRDEAVIPLPRGGSGLGGGGVTLNIDLSGSVGVDERALVNKIMEAFRSRGIELGRTALV